MQLIRHQSCKPGRVSCELNSWSNFIFFKTSRYTFCTKIYWGILFVKFQIDLFKMFFLARMVVQEQYPHMTLNCLPCQLGKPGNQTPVSHIGEHVLLTKQTLEFVRHVSWGNVSRSQQGIKLPASHVGEHHHLWRNHILIILTKHTIGWWIS